MTNECVFDNIRTGFPLQVQIVENSETTDMRQELTTFEKRVKKMKVNQKVKKIAKDNVFFLYYISLP